MLWREHTVYRDRSGGVVIRGEHVQRWISLAPAGGRGEILVRAGRILDGGTTAPARSEVIVPLAAGTGELAAACRRLLAETAAADTSRASGRARSGGADGADDTGRSRRFGRSRRPRKARRSGRHTGFGSWVALVCVVAVIALYVYSTPAIYR
ncbi:hypothetical protein [Streptomyces sp. H27-C3]|uniref:hypothetical protein n=1 Tax=Streptomyces sp. H27-C3 TaxID=3046305 RepID=UPI0024B90BE3|nr:hypothetical protein [Streptomyces sp. H27-C3]MDJ0462906.1 hypothetical protein [Streptomyces sp. H27-C3]